MQKTITFDRLTKDYAARLDGNLIGFYRTHREAEIALNQLAFETLRKAA